MPAMIGPVTWSAYRSVSMTWSMSISVRTGTARRRAEVTGVRALAAATSARSRSGSTPGRRPGNRGRSPGPGDDVGAVVGDRQHAAVVRSAVGSHLHVREFEALLRGDHRHGGRRARSERRAEQRARGGSGPAPAQLGGHVRRQRATGCVRDVDAEPGPHRRGGAGVCMGGLLRVTFERAPDVVEAPGDGVAHDKAPVLSSRACKAGFSMSVAACRADSIA